jgi:16S rRNA U516 pseudouridylate synthase RsuA-like enzyme
MAQLREGVVLEDGTARPRSVEVLEEEHGKALVQLDMTEGRKREVRRMLEAVGHPVERLARVAYAGVELGDLRQGKWRFLTQQEVGRLHAAVEGRPGRSREHRASRDERRARNRAKPRRRR